MAAGADSEARVEASAGAPGGKLNCASGRTTAGAGSLTTRVPGVEAPTEALAAGADSEARVGAWAAALAFDAGGTPLGGATASRLTIAPGNFEGSWRCAAVPESLDMKQI